MYMIALSSFDRSSLDSLLTDKSRTQFIQGNKKQTSCKNIFLEREGFVLDRIDIRDSTSKIPNRWRNSTKICVLFVIGYCSVLNFCAQPIRDKARSSKQLREQLKFFRSNLRAVKNWACEKKQDHIQNFSEDEFKKRNYQRNTLYSTTLHKKWDFSLPVWYC